MTSFGIGCLLFLFVLPYLSSARIIVSKDKQYDILHKLQTLDFEPNQFPKKVQNVVKDGMQSGLIYTNGKRSESNVRPGTLTSKLLGSELLEDSFRVLRTESHMRPAVFEPINVRDKQSQKSINNAQQVTSSYSEKLFHSNVFFQNAKHVLYHKSNNVKKSSTRNSQGNNSKSSDDVLENLFWQKNKHQSENIHHVQKRNVNSTSLNSTLSPTSRVENIDLLARSASATTVNSRTFDKVSDETASSMIALIDESLPTDTVPSSQESGLISSKVNGELGTEAIKLITPTVSNTPADTVSYQPLLSTTTHPAYTPLLTKTNSISTPPSIMSSQGTESSSWINTQSVPPHSSSSLAPQLTDFFSKLQSDKYSSNTKEVNTFSSEPILTTSKMAAPFSSVNTITSSSLPSTMKTSSTTENPLISIIGSGFSSNEQFTGLDNIDKLTFSTTVKTQSRTKEDPAVNTVLSDLHSFNKFYSSSSPNSKLFETITNSITGPFTPTQKPTKGEVASSTVSTPFPAANNTSEKSLTSDKPHISSTTVNASNKIPELPKTTTISEPMETHLATSTKSSTWTHTSVIVERSTPTKSPEGSTPTATTLPSTTPSITSTDSMKSSSVTQNVTTPVQSMRVTTESYTDTSVESTIKTLPSSSPEPSSTLTEKTPVALPETTIAVVTSSPMFSATVDIDIQPTNDVLKPSTISPVPEPEAEQGIGEPPSNPYVTEPTSLAEPGPDWKIAKQQWSFAWEVHLYFFGSIFTLVALYTLISVIRLWTFNRLLSRKYFVTLNLLTFIMCVLRATYLLIDGYNSNGTYHPVIDYLLYSSAFPCLTSAFSILMFALLQATRMQIVPPSVQKFKVLIVIILLHFTISIVTDVVVGLVVGMKIMLFVCQLIFIVWGIFLFFGYAYIFRQVYGSAIKRQKLYSGNGPHSPNTQVKNKMTLSLAVKITFGTAIFGLVTVGLEIYGVAGVYGIFSEKKPSPWPWWSYHTVLRLTECLMCLTISYIASQPFRYRNKKQLCNCCFLCAPCLNMCCCDQSNKSTENIGWSDTDACSNNMSTSVVSGKKRIVLCDKADIIPIVIQPSSNHSDESRPNSLLIIEDGYVRFPTDNDINKMAASYNGINRPEVTNGIVNSAYQGQDLSNKNILNDIKLTNFKRKGSMASSEQYRPPSSISLADSMASELDKAFKSMREDEIDEFKNSLNITMDDAKYFNNGSKNIEAYLEGQPVKSGSLRRSNSDAGDVNIDCSTPRAKLFRSQSDSSGVIRTKQFDNMRYMSLLDLEQAMLDDIDNQSDDSIDLNKEDAYVRNPEVIRQCSLEMESRKGLLSNDQVTEL